jgi:hypothetical protein
MKRGRMLRVALGVGIAVISATVVLSSASARPDTRKVVAADPALTWNTYAVNAVRASAPSKFQVEGLIYMSYVQAAVYDAVTKIAGRYQIYHDFATPVSSSASLAAAVAAAARTTLDYYLPDQQTTVDAEYNAYLGTVTGDVSDGVTIGTAAANDIIALRQNDGRNAATPTYGTIGPILPGQWQLQSPSQTAQTPWVATIKPFVLTRPRSSASARRRRSRASRTRGTSTRRRRTAQSTAPCARRRRRQPRTSGTRTR